MLGYDDPIWKELKGGYKVLYNPTVALQKLENGISMSEAWDELWQELYHQGDVGVASYASVPQLVRIHREKQNLIVPLFLRKIVLGIRAQAIGKNHAATHASGGPDSSCSSCFDPTRGSKHRFAMTLRLIAMPCSFSPQATKNRPALRLSGTKNLRFA